MKEPLTSLHGSRLLFCFRVQAPAVFSTITRALAQTVQKDEHARSIDPNQQWLLISCNHIPNTNGVSGNGVYPQ